MMIRLAQDSDFERIWPFFRDIVRAGETYAFDRDLEFEAGRTLWLEAPRVTYVAEDDGEILGSYFLKTNHSGPGSHVCNCGYMVSRQARGRGVATALCEHSQEIAVELGYRAMQFNFVVASNEGAVRLWTQLGFETVGRVPRAFDHPTLGLVDALVMYKWLDDSAAAGGRKR